MAGPDVGKGTRLAAATGAFICSGDEAGQNLRPPKALTWAPRGRTPVVRVSGKGSGRVPVAGLVCLKAEARGRLFYRVRVYRGRKGERRSMSEADYADVADANRACQSMWDCYEFGCGVDHETFEAEDACAECAAANATKLDLRQLDRTVAGLRARQAALRWPSLRAVTSPSNVRRVPSENTVRPCEPTGFAVLAAPVHTRARLRGWARASVASTTNPSAAPPAASSGRWAPT